MSMKLRRTNKSNSINSKIIEPLKDDAYVIGPGQMASPLTQPVVNGIKQSARRKRKHKDSQSDYQSLDEMLADADNNIDLTYETDEGLPVNGGSREIPASDNLVQLLVQGLQSQNEKMINTTLDRYDSSLIRNTISALPNDMVDPLLKQLHRLFFQKGDRLMNYFLWLQALIQSKLSVILTSKSAQQELASIKQLFATRCDIFDRMCALKGRLSLISNLTEPNKLGDKPGRVPVVKYQETSSEDEDDDDDENLSEKDSEDKDWDRIAVMDLSDTGNEDDDDDDDNQREREDDVEAEDEDENDADEEMNDEADEKDDEDEDEDEEDDED